MAFPGAASVGSTSGGGAIASLNLPAPASAGNFQIAVISMTVDTETITIPQGGAPLADLWVLRANIQVLSSAPANPDRGNTHRVHIYQQITPDTATATFTKSGTRRCGAFRVSWPGVQNVTWLSATPTLAGTGEQNVAATSHATPSITTPPSTDSKVIEIGAVDNGPSPNTVTLSLPGSPWSMVANVASPSTAGAEQQLIGIIEQSIPSTAPQTAVVTTFTTSGPEDMALIPLILHGTSVGPSIEPGRMLLAS